MVWTVEYIYRFAAPVIVAIFSTKDKAKAYCNDIQDGEEPGYFKVAPWPIDPGWTQPNEES